MLQCAITRLKSITQGITYAPVVPEKLVPLSTLQPALTYIVNDNSLTCYTHLFLTTHLLLLAELLQVIKIYYLLKVVRFHYS